MLLYRPNLRLHRLVARAKHRSGSRCPRRATLAQVRRDRVPDRLAKSGRRVCAARRPHAHARQRAARGEAERAGPPFAVRDTAEVRSLYGPPRGWCKVEKLEDKRKTEALEFYAKKKALAKAQSEAEAEVPKPAVLTASGY